jgi:hypothetical protein
MTIKTIDLNKLTLDPRAQPRTRMCLETVESYAESMIAGEEFPPVVVFGDGKRIFVGDGFHRIEGAKRASLASISCDLRNGGLREAIWFSLAANGQHGLRRSNEDKKTAVLKALQDEEWSRMSNRAIAEWVGVSHTFVNKLREGDAPDLDAEPAKPKGDGLAHEAAPARSPHDDEDQDDIDPSEVSRPDPDKVQAETEAARMVREAKDRQDGELGAALGAANEAATVCAKAFGKVLDLLAADKQAVKIAGLVGFDLVANATAASTALDEVLRVLAGGSE